MVPAPILDLASFSFHVPVNASAAKQTAAAKHRARAAKRTFAFMTSSSIEQQQWGPINAECTAASRISQTRKVKCGERRVLPSRYQRAAFVDSPTCVCYVAKDQ